MVTTQVRTANDLWKLGDEEQFELIEGELVLVTPPGAELGEIQATVIGIIREFASSRKPGKVFGDAGYVLQHNPDTVLGPDVSYIASDRLLENRTRYLPVAPDLAVEIVSPSNSAGGLERKLSIYLQAGEHCVWIIYPSERQIAIHLPNRAPTVPGVSDIVTGDPVLPVLTFPVTAHFE